MGIKSATTTAITKKKKKIRSKTKYEEKKKIIVNVTGVQVVHVGIGNDDGNLISMELEEKKKEGIYGNLCCYI